MSFRFIAMAMVRRPDKGVGRGFSLVELLVVIAIMAVLVVASVPAVTSLQQSYQLSRSAALIMDNLQFARQLALARNAPVIASFCSVPDQFGVTGYNALLISQVSSTGSLTAVTPLIRLPQGFSISVDTNWSSLMTLSTTNASLPAVSGSFQCIQVEFHPSGATNLSGTSNWFLTVYHKPNASSTPSGNYITLDLDPVIGRAVSYQP